MGIDEHIKKLVQVEVQKAVSVAVSKLQPEPPTEKIEPTWLTAKDFCAYYGVARSTLQRMKEQDRVDVLYGGGRMVRYRWKTKFGRAEENVS